MKQKIPFHEAVQLAETIAGDLAPTVARLKCVGSIRRRRPMVGDIEFVAEPHFDEGFFDEKTPILEPLRKALLELGTKQKMGERLMAVTDTLGRPGLNLEVYLVHPPSTWGAQLAIRTGPGDLGRYVMTVLKQRGEVLFRDLHATRRSTGELIPTDTEEQFFELADVRCLPPRYRDTQADQLWASFNQNKGAQA